MHSLVAGLRGCENLIANKGRPTFPCPTVNLLHAIDVWKASSHMPLSAAQKARLLLQEEECILGYHHGDLHKVLRNSAELTELCQDVIISLPPFQYTS